jgi:dTDP-4-dehydrorhamnose reductase
MTALPRILLTGGEGRLGAELQALLPEAVAPTEAAMDITDPAAIAATFDRENPEVLVHCAAYTDVAGAEIDRAACWRVNVDGTRNLVTEVLAREIFLVHISTDYVFDGTRGNYAEGDPVGPVCNYYALSKLAAEQVARVAPEHLVIRTSFRPREWAYPVAFTDVFTSQDYVDVIAPMIAKAVRHWREIPYDTVHIATERKSVFDLARRRRPDVQPGTKQQVDVRLPDDISLNVTRWRRLEQQWSDE